MVENSPETIRFWVSSFLNGWFCNIKKLRLLFFPRDS
jgi:hypothetical protein